MGERHEREPVAETLPERIRAQLEAMRTASQPYLERIDAEFEAHPRTLLDHLPAVRAARAVEDEDIQLALLAAAMERHLDSPKQMWRTLMWMLHGDAMRREPEMAQWLSDHTVIGRLWQILVERSRTEHEARLEERERKEKEGEAGSRTRPLPPYLEELLQRHRLAAEPWLERVEKMGDAIADAQKTFLESVYRGEPHDRERLLADAGVEDPKDILRDLKDEPAELQVSVALAWLYEALNEIPRSQAPGVDLGWWSGLNRAALAYEADDFELALGLLDGHRYNWIYAQQLVRAIARYAAKEGAIPDRWHDPLRALLAASAGSRLAEYQNMAVTIRSLLRTAPIGTTRLDLSAIDGADAWSTTVRERLAEPWGDDGSLNELIATLQSSGTKPRPSAAWCKRIEAALDASESSHDALQILLETAIEVRDELVRRTDEGNWLYSTLGEPAALQIRAAAWAAPLSEAAWAPDLLERLVRRYSELFFNGEPYSARVANGAVSALALRADRDSVVRLARLQRVMWHGAMRKHLERELDSLAGAADLTRGQLLELSAPDLGLGDNGTCTLAVGTGGSFTLSLDERYRLVSRWTVAGGTAGTPSPPRALRAAEAERVHELQRHVKQARASLAAERDRIDSMLAEQPRWSLSDWCAFYVRHPVLRVLGRSLVWNVDLGHEIRAATPGDEAGTFVDVEGAAFVATSDAVITLWHPIAASESEVVAWRSALLDRRVAQPIRQVFRETYRLTSDERGAFHSARFAGQLLKQHPLRGLLKRRGWTAPVLLTWDESGLDLAVAVRAFPRFGVRAELSYAPVWTEEALDGIPGGYQLVGTGRLQFSATGPKQADPLALENVPALVVSEAMRDIDLFVSVCSVALDPAWRDVGDKQLHHQWHELAFGELVESARIRRDLLEHALPGLSIADRCAVYDRDLVVRGVRATYRIHLGTGQVRIDPHGSPLTVPRTRAGAAELARLFLPVEADETLAVVLGTAFLLANDDAITDDALLSQLPSLGE